MPDRHRDARRSGKGRRTEAPAGGGSVSGTPKRARILLADGDVPMRDYVAGLLSPLWEVETAADGRAALEAARRRRPDLVLCDGAMPHLSGFELVSALRREPKLADIPVILLSSQDGEDAHVEGLDAGADDYVVRPFTTRTFLARVSSAIALSRLRRDAAGRARRSEARLKAAMDLVGLAPYAWDPVTGALEWDARLKAMWGLAPDAHIDMDVFLAGLHPEDRPRVEAAIAACADPRGDGVYAIEYRVVGIGDGVERWISTQGQTFFDEDRKPVGFVGAALDITARKRAEERLRESEERFRRFAEHSAAVLWTMDIATSRIDYLSPAVERVWGEPPDMLLRNHGRWAEAVHPEDRNAAAAALARALRGESLTREYRILRPDGAVRRIRDTLFPIPDSGGRIRWAAGIAQDVTVQAALRVYLVDADGDARRDPARLLQEAGYEVKEFASTEAFLHMASALAAGCVLLPVRPPDTGALALPRELKARRIGLPVIVLGEGDVGFGVRAMKAGAVDVLELPCGRERLLAAVAAALAEVREASERDRAAERARARVAAMSEREREVLYGLLAGGTNKTIARDLGLSPRTVEVHRAHVMERLGARTLPEAVLVAAAAGLHPPPLGRGADPG
jgi:PAS domain S-box-containing protein